MASKPSNLNTAFELDIHSSAARVDVRRVLVCMAISTRIPRHLSPLNPGPSSPSKPKLPNLNHPVLVRATPTYLVGGHRLGWVFFWGSRPGEKDFRSIGFTPYRSTAPSRSGTATATPATPTATATVLQRLLPPVLLVLLLPLKASLLCHECLFTTCVLSVRQARPGPRAWQTLELGSTSGSEASGFVGFEFCRFSLSGAQLSKQESCLGLVSVSKISKDPKVVWSLQGCEAHPFRVAVKCLPKRRHLAQADVCRFEGAFTAKGCRVPGFRFYVLDRSRLSFERPSRLQHKNLVESICSVF